MAFTSKKGISESGSDDMLQPGSTLLKCEPFVYAGYPNSPDPEGNLEFCDACFKIKDEGLLRCKSCKEVQYCDRSCQEKGWNDGHKYECKRMQILQFAYGSLPMEKRKAHIAYARIILRIIVKLQDGQDYYDSLEIGGKLVKRRFGDFMSCYEKIVENVRRLLATEFHVNISKELLGSKSKIKIPSDEQLVEIYGKVSINAFEISDGCYSLGIGLYLAGSIFNHSCIPTAERVFDGPTMYIRSIMEVPKSLPIDKVTISYSCYLLPSTERRKGLQKEYHFYCECEKCKTGQGDKDMRSIMCYNRDCNAKIDTEEMNGPCSVCGHVMKKEEIALVMEAEMYTTELSDADIDNLGLPGIESCIEKMKSLNFSDSHWLMIKLFDKAWSKAKTLVSHENVVGTEKAYKYGMKCILEKRRYVHPYDYGLFWNLFDMASVAGYLGRPDEAEKYMTEAKSMAEVIHGKDSQFIRSRIDPNLKKIREHRINHAMKQLALSYMQA